MVTSKAKSFTSNKKLKPMKLCTPNPALCFSQDAQSPAEASTSKCVRAEGLRDEEKGRKYMLRVKRGRVCAEEQSSSGSESSSSESDAEVLDGNEAWNLNNP